MLLHTDLEFTGSGLKSARSAPAFRLMCDEIRGEGWKEGVEMVVRCGKGRLRQGEGWRGCDKGGKVHKGRGRVDRGEESV